VLLAYLRLAFVYFAVPAFFRFPVSSLFPSGIDELIVVLIWFTWFYFEIINQTFIAIKNKNSTIVIKNDRLSLLGIYLGALMISYFAGWLGGLRVADHFAQLPLWSFYLGVAVMCSGEVIRQWSIYTLGRFFTFPVVIMKDHKLIRKGPYRYIRHPGYLGGILTFTGLGLALQSWAAALVAAAFMVLVYSYRIYVEEKALRRHFGKSYDDYAKKTAMIIPNLV
jgi:protein-S-isoprenylcysteine O-methyltransferase Ste14